MASADTELKNLKEAIIDLYLAIKIRSTDEVSGNLHYHYLIQMSLVCLLKLLIVRQNR